ncbi:hypothetical protein [Nocardioides terrigena]|uniref:hypothetical protein n=1 Tax=Nocardioides terrigena TaxID=424797 RepID=UPI000D30726C|nr:hypothetical protein [Nocardioides terrigena]
MRGEIVVVLTAGTITDPYSQETVEDWSAPTERAVTTIAPAEPRPSSEPVQDARNAVVSGWTLYLPAGDPIGPQNRVRVRDVEYPVQGQPADWLGAGVVVQAFKTEG